MRWMEDIIFYIANTDTTNFSLKITKNSIHRTNAVGQDPLFNKLQLQQQQQPRQVDFNAGPTLMAVIQDGVHLDVEAPDREDAAGLSNEQRLKKRGRKPANGSVGTLNHVEAFAT